MQQFLVAFVNEHGRLQTYRSNDIILLIRFLVRVRPDQFELFFGVPCESLLNLYCAHVGNPRENVEELKAVTELEEAREEARKRAEEEEAREQKEQAQ